MLTVVGVAGLGAVARLAHGRAGLLIALLILWALFVAVGAYRQLGMRVELHRDEVVIVNWRRRRIPRQDVSDLQTGRFLRMPRAWVRTGAGVRVPLLALDGRVGARDGERFDADVAVLQDWLAGTGA